MDLVSNIQKILMSFFKHSVWSVFLIIVGAILITFVQHRLIDLLFHYQRQTKKYRKSEELKKRSKTIGKISKTVVDIIIWVYSVIAILRALGVNVQSLMTSAGLIGAMLGFGAQNTIRDILAGLYIVLENQYRVGDVIEVQISGRKLAGSVENITLRITQIRDSDGKLHTIRNGANESVTNMSFKYANANLVFNVAYDTDIDKLEKIINRIGEKMLEDEEYSNEIISPIKFIRVNEFRDSSIEIKCRGKVKAGSQWRISGEFRRIVKKAFDQSGIEFAYPQIVVHQAKK